MQEFLHLYRQMPPITGVTEKAEASPNDPITGARTRKTRISGHARKLLKSAEKEKSPQFCGLFLGAPAGIRTPDTLLKRQVLCLLSYWGICGINGWDGGTRTHYIGVKVRCVTITLHPNMASTGSWTKRPALPAFLRCGVGYGARTHDTRNHNPVLYQLS